MLKKLWQECLRDGRTENVAGQRHNQGRRRRWEVGHGKGDWTYAPMIDELAVDEDMKQHLIMKLLEALPNFPMEQA